MKTATRTSALALLAFGAWILHGAHPRGFATMEAIVGVLAVGFGLAALAVVSARDEW